MSGDKGDGAATVQMLCYGSAAASSRYARRDLRCAFTEHLHGVNVCLILDQFDELITCPIQEGDGAIRLSPVCLTEVSKTTYAELTTKGVPKELIEYDGA